MTTPNIADALQQKRREYKESRDRYSRLQEAIEEATARLFGQVIKLFASLSRAGLEIPHEDDNHKTIMIPLPPIDRDAVAVLIKYPPRGWIRIWTAREADLSQEVFENALLHDDEQEPYLAILVDYDLGEEHLIQDGIYLFSTKTEKEAINFIADLLVTIEGIAHEERELLER